MSSNIQKPETAISVRNLSKIYRIGVKDAQYDNLAQSLGGILRSPLRNFRKYRSLYRFSDSELSLDGKTPTASDLVWALKNVSFDIDQGEVVGIIGRNGAGKSTLLKALTRITPPTIGSISISGKVSSLLEVGTGFHQELTGRENVYLNGTILGMRKKEVDRRFDDIVDFSGVSKFLDTPVKRYSSGMRVRLAFSVAAHLEPDIMIIDEVLAVGDAAFQRKCLDKMQDVSQRGSTVLFVSHNMPAINMLCKRAILLQNGELVADGHAHQIVNKYLTDGEGNSAVISWDENDQRPGGEYVKLSALRILNSNGQVQEKFDVSDAITLEVEYDVIRSGARIQSNFGLENDEGVALFTTLDQDPDWVTKPRPEGRYKSSCTIPGNFLSNGRIFVSAATLTISPNVVQFFERHALAFFVSDKMGPGTARGDWPGRMQGAVRPILSWHTDYVRARR